MKRELAPCLAVLLLVAVVTQPVLATPPTGRSAPGEVAVAPQPSQLIQWQDTIAGRLIEIGRPAADARSAASLLTPEDLRVLIDNPDMMQDAGTNVALMLLIGALIIGGLIAIAASSSGSINLF